MHMIAGVLQYVAVASFAEAWIENWIHKLFGVVSESPPSRRRGLKTLGYMVKDKKLGRLLRGGVD